MEDDLVQESPLEGQEMEPGGEMRIETAPAPVDVTNWPVEVTDLPYELVKLSSGATIRVDHHVTYGDLLVASVVTLLLVVEVGRLLFDRIRGVL